MLVVGIVFLFTILRFFLIIPKDDKVSGKYAPIIIPKSFGVGWAINPYHPLGLALLIGILKAIDLMNYFGRKINQTKREIRTKTLDIIRCLGSYFFMWSFSNEDFMSIISIMDDHVYFEPDGRFVCPSLYF